MPIKAPTKAPTRATAATSRIGTALNGRGRDTSSAFATPHTHGRTSFIPPRSKISLTFWESTGDAGQGRNSIVSSASWRGRTAPSSASSPITRLTLSLNRSLSATIVSRFLAFDWSGGQPHDLTGWDYPRKPGRESFNLAGVNHCLPYTWFSSYTGIEHWPADNLIDRTMRISGSSKQGRRWSTNLLLFDLQKTRSKRTEDRVGAGDGVQRPEYQAVGRVHLSSGLTRLARALALQLLIRN